SPSLLPISHEPACRPDDVRRGFFNLRDPLSFPTRRSSDLSSTAIMAAIPGARAPCHHRNHAARPAAPSPASVTHPARRRSCGVRSEEHTSELQSRVDLVCRLLLEKKTQDYLSLVAKPSRSW